ncbi:hypothetical protein RQP46_009004 [Phenoliferia psychrophenolica]
MQSYIVVFKSESDAAGVKDDHIDSLASKVESSGGSIKHRDNSRVMRGFAGSFNDDLKQELEKHPGVKYVEPDSSIGTQ